ncbi:MAG: glutaredoxin family protein [Gammaproteobacteria bacterium]|nr:MAG: glutaredoxin family protein [Gammaproteobacteria bacterium]
MQWILYGTLGCHLCEDAKALLDASPIAGQFREEDIALDDALMERYGIRIPVLRCVASDEELGWPFDAAGLAAFIRGQS